MNKFAIVLLMIAAAFLAACSGGEDIVAAGDEGSNDDPPATQAPGDDGNGADDQLPLGAGPYPVGTLEITVDHPDAEPLSYTISCLGDTATIIPPTDGLNEQTACTRLATDAARALLTDGPQADRVCTEIYGGPDVAAIVGTLDDATVDITVTRNDGCGIDDWDSVLAGVLPPALGVTS